MSDRRWPSFAEIETMESTEAYDLYWNLPAPENAEQLTIIRALGDKAWQLRQEEDAGKAKRTFLPMPEPVPVTTPKPAPKPKFQPKPKAPEEAAGGALFFLAGIKR
jgi:hypothetical protein